MSNNNNNNKTEKFADLISSILLREESLIRPEELSELLFLCTSCKDEISEVDGDELVALIELLEKSVSRGIAINLIQSAIQIYSNENSPSQSLNALDKWLKSGEGKASVIAIRGALEAASVIVAIATTEKVDARAINEDAIESSITLMRHHLNKHLVPAINNTGHISAATTTATSKDTKPMSPSRKRRRSSAESKRAGAGSTSIPPKDLKKLYKQITDTTKLQLLLMERMDYLVKTLALDDQQILLLSHGSLFALEMESNGKTAPPQLQLAANNIITSIFRRYPNHRDIILEDLYPVMLRLPTGKRSLRAFTVSYNSAACPTELEKLNTELMRDYLESSSPPHCIQMITALVLSLVQACVVQPTYQVANQEVVEEESGDDYSDREDEEEQQKQVQHKKNDTNSGTLLQSGLRNCHAVADSFVGQLLKRCTRSKTTGGASEYRPFLSNLIDDLLLVVLIPEYPAAEILLSAFQRRLNEDLIKANAFFSKSSKHAQFDTTYSNAAFDAMGKICAFQARVLALSRDKPIHVNDANDAPMSNTSDKEVDCHCQRGHTDVFMIQCDQCEHIYHGTCVGICDKESTPDEWFCDGCCLGKVIARELSKSPGNQEYFDMHYVLYHSFQSVTAHKLGVNMEDAVKIHLARWIDQLERKRLQAGLGQSQQLVMQLLEYWDQPGPAAEPLTDEGSLRVILSLMAKTSPFFLSFREQIKIIVKIMSDPNAHSLRKLSLKALGKVVEGDSRLMLLPIITKAVSQRLSDESISVREAAVSLVGGYVVKSPVAMQKYHSALLPCLTDQGVSVRKRAVRIFQEILLGNPHYRGRSSVCNIMLQRSADPKEEDGVRDLIDDLFCALWLRNGEEKIECANVVADRPVSVPGVVTPTTPENPTLKQVKRSDIAAEQMMEVVKAGQTGEHLESLLQKLLAGGAESDSNRKKAEKKRRSELGKKQCTQLIDALFELLVVVDEQRELRKEVGRDIAAALTTIAVFSNVSPFQVLKHLDTILPYLEADNGVSAEDEAAIVYAACNIIHRLSSTYDRQILQRLSSGSLSGDLTKITYRFGPMTLKSAIRAFSSLAHHPENSEPNVFAKKLLHVGKTFYDYILKKNDTQNFSLISDKIQDSVHRALTVLGFICENQGKTVDSSTWGDEVEGDGPLMPQEDLTWDNITLACYRIFSKYLAKDDPATKCKALAALKGIFLAQPQLLLQLDHVGLFDEVMSKNAFVELQLEALECWKNILTSEELRIDSGQAAAKMDADGNITLSKRISGDQNGDATLFGGVLTNHAERIFEMTHDLNPTIRRSSLELLGLLLRQGLVNPNEAVPHLLALQGDIENEAVRSLALHYLMIEGEKRPDTLRQRVCDGVKRAYEFQRLIYPHKTKASALIVSQDKNGIKADCIFSRVFKECIASSRKQRQGLYKSLLTLFEYNDTPVGVRSKKKGKPESKDLSMLSFAAQILAHLPFTASTDPLFIIHHITSTITLQGHQTLDRLAAFLRPYGLASADEYDDNNFEEDALELAAMNKFPSRTSQARPLCTPEFDIAKFVYLVRDGAALILLLRLKQFLRTTYNLSLTRCLEYDPNAKERLFERGISKQNFSEPFDGFVDQLQRNKAVDKDAVIRLYAEFRRMMREHEQVEDASNSSEDEDDNEVDDEEAEDELNRSSRKRSASDSS